jgi:DNA-binding transcriptional MerR regulator
LLDPSDERRTKETTTVREYFTPKQMAEILDVTEARVRQWQARGLITPAFLKGPVEYPRKDLVRMAILTALAAVFEQPIEFIDKHSDTMSVLAARIENGTGEDMVVRLSAPTCEVELKPALVAKLRERIAETTR